MNCEDRLTETIRDIRARLERGEYGDEAKVSQGIVTRLLNDLGWPVYDTTVVAREYSIQGRRVDYALFGRFATPTVLLEAKRVGRIEVGEQQLFEYAFHEGTPILVLSDGREWWLYLTTGEGNYPDRRFAEANLSKEAPEKNAAILCRYLEREVVASGEAKKRAEEALEERQKRRAAEKALPAVWNRLVDEADGPLIQLIRSRVARECGTTPSEEAIRRFLRGRGHRHPCTDDPPPDPPPGKGGCSIILDGETRWYRDRAALLVGVFSTLAQDDPTFLERFDAAWGFRKRVARSREELRPGPDTAFARLPGGWWIHIRCSNETAEKLVRKACEVAGVECGPISW